MSISSTTTLTYKIERARAVFTGILDTAASTFLLSIAVRVFQAGEFAKALIASGFSVGLLVSPLAVSLTERYRFTPTHSAARILWIGGAAFLLASLFKIEWVFISSSIIGLACFAAIIPLMTQVYQENYPETSRGGLFARTTVIRIVSGAVAGHLLGRALTNFDSSCQWVLGMFGLAMIVSGYLANKIPSSPLQHSGAFHPFKALRFIERDPVFRRSLVGWMFLGFGNLMMIPLRVEYLANPKYGVKIDNELLSIGAIAFYTTVLPNIARVVVNPLWGWLFDRANFFILRIALNIGFMLGILTFFMSDSPIGLVIGAIFYGIAISGGDVAWGLWVTKFAPPARVADYMAVHTFLTGIRGILAPLLAFHLTRILPIQTISIFAAALILIGTIVFFTEVKLGAERKEGPLMVEELE